MNFLEKTGILIKKYNRFVLIFVGVVLLFTSFQKYSTYSKIDSSNYLPSELAAIAKISSSEIFTISEISSSSHKSLKIEFKSPVKFDAFSFVSVGNMAGVASFSPRDFNVHSIKNDKAALLKEIRNNTDPEIFIKLSDPQTIDGIVLEFIIANQFNTVSISDFSLYTKSTVGFIDYLVYLNSKYSKGVLYYFIITFVLLLYLFVPGVVILKTLLKKYLNGFSLGFTYVLGPIISIFILFILGCITVISGLNLFLHAYSLLFIICFFFFIQKKYYLDLYIRRKLIFYLLLILFFLNITQAHRDYILGLPFAEKYLDSVKEMPFTGGYYGYHVDNTRTWGFSRILLERVPLDNSLAQNYIFGEQIKTVFDRTPLASISYMPILSSFGKSHFFYQRYLNVLVFCFFLSVFYLISNLFNRKVAYLTHLCILLNVPLLLQVFSTERHLKYFAFYPLLLTFYFIYKKKIVWASFTLFMAYFIHPSVLLFIPTILLCVLFIFGLNKSTVWRLLYLVLPTSIFFIVWNAFVSLYIYQVLFQGEISANNMYISRVNDFSSTYVLDKISNAFSVFIPGIFKESFSFMYSREYLQRILNYSLLSSVSPLVVYYAIKNIFVERTELKFAIILTVIPYITFLVYIPNYTNGTNFIQIYPILIPLLFAFFFAYSSRLTTFVRILAILGYLVMQLISIRYISEIGLPSLYVNSATKFLFLAFIAVYLFVIFKLSQVFLFSRTSSKI